MNSPKNFLRIVPVLAGVLATGCGDIVHVNTAADMDNTGKQNAPSYASAKSWPKTFAHTPRENIEVSDIASAREALLASKQKLKEGDTIGARNFIYAIERFYSDDLMSAVDGVNLKNWNRDSGMKGLEGSVAFLEFMSDVYETAYKTDASSEKKQRLFDNVVKTVTFGEIYRDCLVKGGKPGVEIKKRYTGLGIELERMLKGKLEGRRENESKSPHLVLSNSVNEEPIRSVPLLRASGLVAQREKIYDKEDPAGLFAQAEKYTKGLQEKERRFAQTYHKPNPSDFILGDPITGNARDIRAQTARVVRQF